MGLVCTSLENYFPALIRLLMSPGSWQSSCSCRGLSVCWLSFRSDWASICCHHRCMFYRHRHDRLLYGSNDEYLHL